MRTNAGEPLISNRPFAVTKCSPWLASKQKTLELQNPVPKTIGKTKPRCRNVWIWSFVWGMQLVASEPQPAPGYCSYFLHSVGKPR
jgi:hypothetical protein